MCHKDKQPTRWRMEDVSAVSPLGTYSIQRQTHNSVQKKKTARTSPSQCSSPPLPSSLLSPPLAVMKRGNLSLPSYRWLQLCHLTFKYSSCAYCAPKAGILNYNSPAFNCQNATQARGSEWCSYSLLMSCREQLDICIVPMDGNESCGRRSGAVM